MALVINQLIYLAITLGMAFWHFRLIKSNKPIKHGWWSLLAVAVAGLFGLIDWLYIPVMLMIRALVFSPALSLWRGLPITYASLTSTSIIDKIERKVFRTWGHKMGVYLGVFILLELTLIFNS
jgi:hypothetical protein